MENPRNKIVADALNVLAEHFDAVQIFATYQEEGKTQSTFKGIGNFYTRVGMAREFLIRDHAETDQWARRKADAEET
jgi:hypothetical protein